MVNIPRESEKTATDGVNSIETNTSVLIQQFNSMGNFKSSIDVAPDKKIISIQPRQIAISENFTKSKSIQSVNENSLSIVAHAPAGKVIKRIRYELDG